MGWGGGGAGKGEKLWQFYHLVAKSIIWLRNLSFGCEIYHMVAKSIIWLGNLSFGWEIYHLVAKSIIWLGNLSFGWEIYHLVGKSIIWLAHILIQTTNFPEQLHSLSLFNSNSQLFTSDALLSSGVLCPMSLRVPA